MSKFFKDPTTLLDKISKEVVSGSAENIESFLAVGTNKKGQKTLIKTRSSSETTTTGQGTGYDLSDKPATPHAYDEEFEGDISGWTAIKAGWPTNLNSDGTSATIESGAPDVYSSYTGGGAVRYEVNNAHKPSWIKIQPKKDSIALGKSVDFSSIDNCLVYARLNFQKDLTTYADDLGIGISLRNPDLPTSGKWLGIYLQDYTDNDRAAAFWQTSTYPSVGSGYETADIGTAGQALEYVAIHMTDLGESTATYHYWVGTNSNWILLGTYSISPPLVPKRVEIVVNNKGNTSYTSGAKQFVGSCDFIRFIETDKFVL